MESFAYVLDYLPTGRQTDRGYSRQPIAYGLGETELKLLEIVPRGLTPLVPGRRIPLLPVDGAPPPIDHVRRRISPEELTTAARSELPVALEQIVRQHPEKYLRFFNEAPAVSRRFHLLELLPGIGKKTMQAIVDDRRRAPFTSFEDLAQRVHLKDPERLIAARMERELTGVEDKYRLFIAP